jgi:hypothetical protein
VTTKALREELDQMLLFANYLDQHVREEQWDRVDQDLAQLQTQSVRVVAAARECRLAIRDIRDGLRA